MEARDLAVGLAAGRIAIGVASLLVGARDLGLGVGVLVALDQ